jgi:hypothetical protein
MGEKSDVKFDVNSLDILQTFSMFQERSVDPRVNTFIRNLWKGNKVATFTFTDDVVRLEYQYTKEGEVYKSVIMHANNPDMVLRDCYMDYGTISLKEYRDKDFFGTFQESLKSATNIETNAETNKKLIASIRIEFEKGEITDVIPKFVDGWWQLERS